MADRILQSVRARFGGRLRIVYNGSAPLSPAVANFLRVSASPRARLPMSCSPLRLASAAVSAALINVLYCLV